MRLRKQPVRPPLLPPLPRKSDLQLPTYPMKKWLYLILPVVMTGVFLMFFFKHEKETVARETARGQEMAQKAAADKAVKDAAEAKAKESARIAQLDRDRENAEREAARKAQQDAVDKEIKDKTDASLAEIARDTKRAKELELEIARLITDRERITREAFDLAKQVELAMVAKRNAELEEQRLTEMIARRATESSMTKLPPPPAPPAAKS